MTPPGAQPSLSVTGPLRAGSAPMVPLARLGPRVCGTQASRRRQQGSGLRRHLQGLRARSHQSKEGMRVAGDGSERGFFTRPHRSGRTRISWWTAPCKDQTGFPRRGPQRIHWRWLQGRGQPPTLRAAVLTARVTSGFPFLGTATAPQPWTVLPAEDSQKRVDRKARGLQPGPLLRAAGRGARGGTPGLAGPLQHRRAVRPREPSSVQTLTPPTV